MGKPEFEFIISVKYLILQTNNLSSANEYHCINLITSFNREQDIINKPVAKNNRTMRLVNIVFILFY